jgi:hypothetical protein
MDTGSWDESHGGCIFYQTRVYAHEQQQQTYVYECIAIDQTQTTDKYVNQISSFRELTAPPSWGIYEKPFSYSLCCNQASCKLTAALLLLYGNVGTP